MIIEIIIAGIIGTVVGTIIKRYYVITNSKASLPFPVCEELVIKHVHGAKLYNEEELKIRLTNCLTNKKVQEEITTNETANEINGGVMTVDYNLNGVDYTIVINGDLYKKYDVAQRHIKRHILSAHLSKNDKEQELEQELDITEKIQKLLGPSQNFYKNLSGVSYKFNDILNNSGGSRKWDQLVIHDIFGSSVIFDLNDSDEIIW
jgi:hypothetical protein